MSTMLTESSLIYAIAHHAAFRRVRRLQPAGGAGDKIFPPTYPGSRQIDPPRHLFERRRGAGEDVWCVLIDSVQSQANRLEEALLAVAKEGLPLPYVTVDFNGKGLDPLDQITSLDAPHRVYDAILRDSLAGDDPFMRSKQGKRLAAATPADATALLELSPSALLFGAWHSQGEGGGLGAKFPRALVSEIMGIDTPVDEVLVDLRTGETEPRTTSRRAGIRIDPLGILRKVEVFKGASVADWSTAAEETGQRAKKVRPSEILHGNIISTVAPLGVTCSHAEHRVVITLAGLRRLRFGGGQRDVAGRALLVALGLVALVEQDARGYALRSRCDLVCEGVAPLELVRSDGSTESLELDRAGTRALYVEMHKRAVEAGFEFQSLTLTPQPKLIEVVRRSRELALESKGGEEDNE